MSRSALLARRFSAEYVRRPLNVVLLVVVPLGLVTLSAGAIADFADVLGGLSDLGTIEAATAGWAAALLAGISGFFQVNGSRAADRRLASAGMGTAPVVAGRLATSVALAGLASVGSLVALAMRTGLEDPLRTIAVTVLMALIYLGLGLAVGAVVHDEVNGSLIVVFLWMFDVFFGPAMGGSGLIIRALPLHFPTTVVIDLASGHAGPLGDLGLSLLWAVAALGVGIGALAATTGRVRAHRSPARRRPRVLVALRCALVDYGRNPVLWALLVGLPLAFISLSVAVTPSTPTPVELTEHGRTSLVVLPMSTLHGAIMVPITVGFLTGLAGLFVSLGSADADGRLVFCGFGASKVLVARLGVILVAASLTTVVSVIVTSRSLSAESWATFTVANLLAALTYGLIGFVVGPRLGLLGGLYVMLALPFIDIGIGQNAMFDAAPPAWATVMPAAGSVAMTLDAAFTPSMDDPGAVAAAAGWLLGLTLLAAWQFHRRTAAKA